MSFTIFCRLLPFFIINFFLILSGRLSECQTVWISIRTNILLSLTWVQTICKGYRQMTKVAASRQRVIGRRNNLHHNAIFLQRATRPTVTAPDRESSLFFFLVFFLLLFIYIYMHKALLQMAQRCIIIGLYDFS